MQPTEPPQASGSGQPVPAAPEPAPPAAGPPAGAPAPPPVGYPAQPGYPQAGQPPQPGYPQQPARPKLPVNLGDVLTAAGGALVFFFSFAPFVTYASADLSSELDRSNLPTWFSAWSPETFMAPLTWFVALGGLVIAGLAATRLVVPRDREYYGFRIGHLQVGLGLFLFLTLFGYATAAKSAVFGHDFGVQFAGAQSANLAMHFGWGGYVMLFGGLVAAVGAVLSYLQIGPIVYPQPPKPAAVYPLAAGYPPGYGTPQYPGSQQPGYVPGVSAGYQPAAPAPQQPAPQQPVPPAAPPEPSTAQPQPAVPSPADQAWQRGPEQPAPEQAEAGEGRPEQQQ